MAFSACEGEPGGSPVTLERLPSGVAVLTLSHAMERNVVTHAWADAMLTHCASVRADTGIGAVLLRAQGPAFCVGADVRDMAGHMDGLSAHIASLIDHAHAAIVALQTLPMPVVACVQGVAAGGGVSLALACDSVVAARSARFVMAYPQLGTTPDCGLSHYLSELLGPRRALQVLLAPGALDAAQALALGLVAQVVDDEDLQTAALALVTHLAGLPHAAVRGAKALLLEHSHAALLSQLDREKEAFLQCAGTVEFRARVRAFAYQGHPAEAPSERQALS